MQTRGKWVREGGIRGRFPAVACEPRWQERKQNELAAPSGSKSTRLTFMTRDALLTLSRFQNNHPYARSNGDIPVLPGPQSHSSGIFTRINVYCNSSSRPSHCSLVLKSPGRQNMGLFASS